MTSLRITMRAGERIFVNGAVLRVERKTTLEFLNDVTFLLESHVMQAEEATTPLRQLYFIAQSMLMDPAAAQSASLLFKTAHAGTLNAFQNEDICKGLAEIGDLMARQRVFEVLKCIRAMIPLEDEILGDREIDDTAAETDDAPMTPEPRRVGAGGRR